MTLPVKLNDVVDALDEEFEEIAVQWLEEEGIPYIRNDERAAASDSVM